MSEDLNRRCRIIHEGSSGKGPVIYWMSREQRPFDNYALSIAQREAIRRRKPLVVIFCIVSGFAGAPVRHYDFMLRGLSSTAEYLSKKNIRFELLIGDPSREISKFAASVDAAMIVSDFDPSKIKAAWKRGLFSKTRVSHIEVDSRNVVPCHVASPKQEFGARTLRPKIEKLLPDYLVEMPKISEHPFGKGGRFRMPPFEKLFDDLSLDRSVAPVELIKSGFPAAASALKSFIKDRLPKYADMRNDPSLNFQSGLSPYLHFGQISAQRVALEVLKSGVPKRCKDAFLEELIVRRELSDNFCSHNSNYDSMKGAPEWALKTLAAHAKDKRIDMYSLGKMEAGRTKDEYWNAAQMQMVLTGKMHGYMRMYWAKKILEWSPNPAVAVRRAIYLNDKYELDGRDSNGYAGILWAVGGLHDRPWPQRKIFGTVRYMSAGGLKSKFDMDEYVRSFHPELAR